MISDQEFKKLCDQEFNRLCHEVKSRLTQRKIKLFICACIREIWHLIDDQRSKSVVEITEKYVDELATSQELAVACESAWDAASSLQSIASVVAWNITSRTPYYVSPASKERQYKLLLCISGITELLPTWRTATVLNLAKLIYEERSFGDLPVLADALEDAGCTADDILNHLRNDSVHARGCYVLDLILEKV